MIEYNKEKNKELKPSEIHTSKDKIEMPRSSYRRDSLQALYDSTKEEIEVVEES